MPVFSVEIWEGTLSYSAPFVNNLPLSGVEKFSPFLTQVVGGMAKKFTEEAKKHPVVRSAQLSHTIRVWLIFT